MGLQKVAFNFMVERGGKLAKSLICSKPLKQHNISELGVCLSDNSIHFQTEKSAIKYIKNQLINSLDSTKLVTGITGEMDFIIKRKKEK